MQSCRYTSAAGRAGGRPRSTAAVGAAAGAAARVGPRSACLARRRAVVRHKLAGGTALTLVTRTRVVGVVCTGPAFWESGQAMPHPCAVTVCKFGDPAQHLPCACIAAGAYDGAFRCLHCMSSHFPPSPGRMSTSSRSRHPRLHGHTSVTQVRKVSLYMNHAVRVPRALPIARSASRVPAGRALLSRSSTRATRPHTAATRARAMAAGPGAVAPPVQSLSAATWCLRAPSSLSLSLLVRAHPSIVLFAARSSTPSVGKKKKRRLLTGKHWRQLDFFFLLRFVCVSTNVCARGSRSASQPTASAAARGHGSPRPCKDVAPEPCRTVLSKYIRRCTAPIEHAGQRDRYHAVARGKGVHAYMQRACSLGH